ncbi:unnamed protein product [Vitrella brassicaformis CCMP3155]|uniref:Digalactosyldiacylglycerol synthase n=2 Tax=Vitrella brassicaformis TaxID=1169539 RepID=A0A0G4H2P9_VITBC|nr:unnamed protein product [Vitrella brassicaformis CCMP3155]|eukprot:CEM37817.1 unnamed protein product [Vitrella brassicaformis CCMP3155]
MALARAAHTHTARHDHPVFVTWGDGTSTSPSSPPSRRTTATMRKSVLKFLTKPRLARSSKRALLCKQDQDTATRRGRRSNALSKHLPLTSHSHSRPGVPLHASRRGDHQPSSHHVSDHPDSTAPSTSTSSSPSTTNDADLVKFRFSVEPTQNNTGVSLVSRFNFSDVSLQGMTTLLNAVMSPDDQRSGRRGDDLFERLAGNWSVSKARKGDSGDDVWAISDAITFLSHGFDKSRQDRARAGNATYTPSPPTLFSRPLLTGEMDGSELLPNLTWESLTQSFIGPNTFMATLLGEQYGDLWNISSTATNDQWGKIEFDWLSREGGGSKNMSTRSIATLFNELLSTALNDARRPATLSAGPLLPWLEEMGTEGTSDTVLWTGEIAPSSDMSSPNRRICVVTTASLPWRTGTAVNPLLRAAYLTRGRPSKYVTLLLPWLEEDQQGIVFPKGKRFKTQDEQARYVKEWLSESAGMAEEAEELQIKFYRSRYHSEFGSIFPMGDITQLIPDEEADVCILEEPEHLNWYRAVGDSIPSWPAKFKHVVGVIHTNYVKYARTETAGFIKEPFLYVMNQWMCRSYCDRIIKLSDTLQRFAPEKEVTCNVHGVRDDFLQIGDEAAVRGFSKGAYFIGKALWAKGHDMLFDLLKYTRRRANGAGHVSVDVYGSGPDEHSIKQTAHRMKVPVHFFPGVDHAHCKDYKVFVNPSISEVLCTTSAEALAMGKFIIIPRHPSNTFFEQFRNCLTYRDKEEFAANLVWALKNNPVPLSQSERFALSWEAATTRFIEAATVPKAMAQDFRGMLDRRLAELHSWLGRGRHGDLVRYLAGASREIAAQNDFLAGKEAFDWANVKVSSDQDRFVRGMRVNLMRILRSAEKARFRLSLVPSDEPANTTTWRWLIPPGTGTTQWRLEDILLSSTPTAANTNTSTSFPLLLPLFDHVNLTMQERGSLGAFLTRRQPIWKWDETQGERKRIGLTETVLQLLIEPLSPTNTSRFRFRGAGVTKSVVNGNDTQQGSRVVSFLRPQRRDSERVNTTAAGAQRRLPSLFPSSRDPPIIPHAVSGGAGSTDTDKATTTPSANDAHQRHQHQQASSNSNSNDGSSRHQQQQQQHDKQSSSVGFLLPNMFREQFRDVSRWLRERGMRTRRHSWPPHNTHPRRRPPEVHHVMRRRQQGSGGEWRGGRSMF